MTTTARPDLAAEAKRRNPPLDFYREQQAPLPTTRATGEGWQDGGLCPFHDDTHAGNFRVNIITGGFTCLACGAKGGDVIAYTMLKYGLDFKAACARLGAESRPMQPTNGHSKPYTAAAPTNGHSRPYTDAEPTNGHANGHSEPATTPKRAKKADYPPPWDWPRLEILEAVYPYEDPDTQAVVFEVLKSVDKHFCQRRPDPDNPGRHVYNLTGVDRPLFREAQVRAAVAAGKKVFLVEGEKDVLNLAAMGITATSIAGGAKAPWTERYTTALSATTVLIIPDHDKPGHEYAQRVLLRLPDACLLELPGLAEHGDVSDWIAAGGTKQDLVKLARQALDERDNRPAPAAPDKEDAARPFRCLGYNNGHYYFMTKRQGQVMALTSSSLRSKPTFLELAPLQYWEGRYSSENGPNWTAAADALIQACIAAGLYNNDHRRGRGAWWDDSGADNAPRVVLHQGNSLLVDGEEIGLLEFDTRYVYERAPRLSIANHPPITAESAGRLVSICKMLTFEHPAAAQLLAGWLAIAPICGILRWRPHIWVTGPAGCGKSWIMDHIIKAIVGGLAEYVQSCSTEAGIRQRLGSDARPVLFDEAESEDDRSNMSMQRVLELARQASSEGGAVIAKGSASGEAQTFSIRSCFCLGSVAVGVRRRADETRVTILQLCARSTDTEDERGEARDAFEDLQAAAAEICTPEFSAGLVARSCKLAKVIRTNAETFSVAVAQALGSRRAGDQLGALLAGYWSLWSDEEIELGKATEYARELNLTDMIPDDESRDETRCLAHLFEQVLVVDMGSGPAKHLSIGELVDAARSIGKVRDVADSIAADTLKRHGMRVMDDGLAVSNTHSAIAKLLSGTPWGISWKRFLKRIRGAEAPKKPITFPGHVVSRVTFLPWAVLDGGENEDVAAPQIGKKQVQEETDDLPF